MRISETTLFEPVKKWLEYAGNTVYSEVQPDAGGRRADIVAVNHGIVTVVEMKTSMSLDLLEQAIKWRNCAHNIYIAVPRPKKGRNCFVDKILYDYGIGLLQVDTKWMDVLMVIKPRLFRRITIEWGKVLTDAHKQGPPGGSKGGGYVTAYSQTIERVRQELLRAKRPLSVAELLERCETHYRCPKSSLANALKELERDWVEPVYIDKKLHFKLVSA